METWDNNLDDLMNSGGYHRIKELNLQLYNWCSLWVERVNRYDGIRALVADPNQPHIEVKERGILNTPFYSNLYYYSNIDNQVELAIKSVKGFNHGGYIKASLQEESDLTGFLLWEESNYLGKEIYQQGFVLELLNIALNRYFHRNVR